MGSLIMPKHTGLVSEFQTPLKVCYDRKDVNDGWVENGHAAQGIDGFTLYLYQEYHAANAPGHTTPKRDNSDYTKDAQLPLYFGFMEITDSRSNALRRITPSGIEMYEALIADDKDKIYSLFVNAMETLSFGRNNSGCENSDSDLEAPNILLVSSLVLDGVKRKEYYYILEYINKHDCDLSNALSRIAYYRKRNEDVPSTAVTYTDVKFIPLWVSLGFLVDAADGKLYLAPDVLAQFAVRIMSLRIKNTEPLKIRAPKFVGPTIQTIYYGCPGTGKSHEVKRLTEGLDNEKVITFDDGTTNVFRTTFHPDYDYSTFVGCYKPVKENGKLDYRFVPQVFTNAYVAAKKHPDTPIYLIIEEINRGNCAQIFGDLFQLLDRETGVSKFPINAEEELMKYLRDDAEMEDYIKIALPNNFNIYATMNTSDQSLFPMDSAFKRRWEMKYIKIDYDNKDADYTFKVNGVDYHWLEYLPCINGKITLATDSEDKQMGEFFIRSNMTATEFKNKVMFYLWNDVCKDLYSGKNSPQSFFFRDLYGDPFKFTELFNEPAKDATEEDKKDPRKNGDILLEGFLYFVKNGKKKAPKTEAITGQAAEENEGEGEQTAE